MAGIKVTIDLDESQAVNALKALNTQLGKTEDQAEKTGKKFDQVTSSFLGNLAAIAATRSIDFIRQQFSQAFDTFVEFEQGLISVAKTANLTAEETNELAKNVLRLNSVIPASTKELNDIAAAAGQLGITGVGNLTKFTDTIAKLGRASDLQGEEAATTLTRILNVTRENIGTIDTFSSVIVSLGNNFAATESEIALVTNEVSRATAQFGVSASEAAALSATLRSVGIRAEEAGGVLSNTFIKIDEAIRKGGAGLQTLEKITGLTGEQIKKQFGEDAIGLFRNFVAGLGRVGESGGSVNNALSELGITGIRVAKVLPTLAANTSEFDRALALANAEVQNATALNDEFSKVLESTGAKSQLLSNSFERLRIRIGEGLAGAFDKVAGPLTSFIDTLAQTELEGFAAFAKGTEDVNKLTKELKVLEGQAEAVKNNPLNLPEFLLADPKEIADKIQILNNRIRELGDNQAADTLNNLKTELKQLDSELNNSDPLLLSLYGSKESIEARKTEVLQTIRNLEQQAILEGKTVIEQGEKEKTDAVVAATEERINILRELRNAQKEEEATIAEEERLQKALSAEADLQFLSDNLGKENVARELARIQNLDSETKRNEELKKLRLKAREEEKASLIDLQKFENMTNTQKVAAQRETLQTISSLSRSNNDVLFTVGKASSLALAAINVSEGVTKALAAFPPPFNFAAAAAVGAAGAVQIANISKMQKPSAGSFQDGGIVGGSSFTGDRLTANVNSGEMILNRRQQANLFNTIDSGASGGGVNVTINNPMVLNQGGIDAIIDQINDAVEFRNKQLRTA